MKRLTFFLLLALAFPTSSAAKEQKIRGYVTKVISAMAFEIEDYRITRDAALVLEFEKSEEDKEPIEFRPEDIRIGTEIEIRGEYDEVTSELRARSMKIILEDHRKVKRTALIEKAPALKRTEGAWEGTFFADGQSIRVDPATKVFFKPNESEKKVLKGRERGKTQPATATNSTASGEEHAAFVRPLESLEGIGPNTFISYEGLRQADATIAATRVEFLRNELEKGEAKLWKDLTPKTKQPNFLEGKPGELKIPKVGKFKLVPTAEAQQYVRELGERLIPPHQKALPAGDPNKIPFQFHLVEGKQANAFATPNGIIVVSSPMFKVLENEAQLAAVMGHEIAHSIQEHTWREHQYHRKKLMAMRIGGIIGAAFGGRGIMDIVNMVEGAIRNGYSRSLENQADRAGLEYMLAAGYDLREAPRVWKQITKEYGDRPTDFFWSSHDNHTTRRSYLMAELRLNYPDAGYDKLVTNEAGFQRIAELVKSAKPKGKVKVKL